MDLDNFLDLIPNQENLEINKEITIDDEKTFLLHLACKENCLEAVEWCFEKGADLFQVDKNGYIPIVYTTDLEIMIYLFNKCDLSYYTLPNENNLNSMINNLIDEEEEYEEEEYDDYEYDDDEEDEYEEEILVNMPKDNKTSLFLEACRYGNNELINFLLTNTKVDLYFSDFFKLTGLHYLCDKYENFPLLVEILDNYDFDLKTESVVGETILFEVVKTLCYRENDNLPINFEILDYLLSKPFDINKTNILQESILYTTVLLEGFQTFSYLLKNPYININSVDNEKMNILMRTIIADCDIKYVKSILEHPEFNINYRNTFGDTALSIAADLEMDKFIDLLISYGSDTTIKNNDDKNLYEEYLSKKKYGV